MHIPHNRILSVSDHKVHKKYAAQITLFTAHRSSGGCMTQTLSTCPVASGKAAGQWPALFTQGHGFCSGHLKLARWSLLNVLSNCFRYLHFHIQFIPGNDWIRSRLHCVSKKTFSLFLLLCHINATVSVWHHLFCTFQLTCVVCRCFTCVSLWILLAAIPPSHLVNNSWFQ